MSVPASTRQVHLASYPDGRLTTDAFRFVDVPLAAPEPGHVLVRNDHLGLAAVMREQMDPTADLPFPLFEVDHPLTAFAVGTVVASARDDVEVGALVSHPTPWAGYADAPEVTVLAPDALPAPQYHLATGNGATALLGVRDVGAPP